MLRWGYVYFVEKTVMEVPDGLSDLLQEFTIAVLRSKPNDLIKFAADYFNNMQDKNTKEKKSISPKLETKGDNPKPKKQAGFIVPDASNSPVPSPEDTPGINHRNVIC